MSCLDIKPVEVNLTSKKLGDMTIRLDDGEFAVVQFHNFTWSIYDEATETWTKFAACHGNARVRFGKVFGIGDSEKWFIVVNPLSQCPAVDVTVVGHGNHEFLDPRVRVELANTLCDFLNGTWGSAKDCRTEAQARWHAREYLACEGERMRLIEQAAALELRMEKNMVEMKRCNPSIVAGVMEYRK